MSSQVNGVLRNLTKCCSCEVLWHIRGMQRDIAKEAVDILMSCREALDVWLGVEENEHLTALFGEQFQEKILKLTELGSS
jgi:hypothetical protein